MPQIRNAQGQLVETTEEEIQKLAAQQGTPLPASPAAASGIGASPDAAKMAGTPAQKASVFQQAAQSAPQSLQQAQRYEGAARDATAQEQAAQDKAKRLQELGTLGTRVQGLVEQKIKAQEAELRVNEQALQDAGMNAEATSLLQAVLSSPPENREAALVAAANQLGLETTASIGQFITGPEQAVASLGGEQLAFTVGELELEDKPQIAADLGVDEATLNAMSVDELEKSVQELEAREFNRVQDLKAELPNASPAKRQRILRQLRSLSYMGVTGLEQELDALEEEVKSGKSVTIGGQTLSLQQVLEDDALSDVIRDALQDEDRFEQLKEESPELAEFLDAQRVALEDTLSEVRKSTTDFASTQQEFDTFVDSVPSAVLGAIHGDEVPQFVTQAEREQIEQKVRNNGLYQATQQNSDLLLKVQSKPALAGLLAKHPAEDINSMWEATQDVQQDETIEALSGVDGDVDMITNMAQASKVLDTKKRLATISNKVKNNASIQTAIREGDLDISDLKKLDKNPNVSVELYIDNKRVQSQWERVKKSDADIAEFLFGAGTGKRDANAAYKKAASLKGTSKEFKRMHDMYASLDVNKDGKIEARELRKALPSKGLVDNSVGGMDYGSIVRRLRGASPALVSKKAEVARKQQELEERKAKLDAENKRRAKAAADRKKKKAIEKAGKSAEDKWKKNTTGGNIIPPSHQNEKALRKWYGFSKEEAKYMADKLKKQKKKYKGVKKGTATSFEKGVELAKKQKAPKVVSTGSSGPMVGKASI